MNKKTIKYSIDGSGYKEYIKPFKLSEYNKFKEHKVRTDRETSKTYSYKIVKDYDEPREDKLIYNIYDDFCKLNKVDSYYADDYNVICGCCIENLNIEEFEEDIIETDYSEEEYEDSEDYTGDNEEYNNEEDYSGTDNSTDVDDEDEDEDNYNYQNGYSKSENYKGDEEYAEPSRKNQVIELILQSIYKKQTLSL